MFIAMIWERGSDALISAGEGRTENEAKANAILDAPKEFDNLAVTELEWELEQIAD